MKNFMQLPKIKEFFEKDENKLPFLPPYLAKIQI